MTAPKEILRNLYYPDSPYELSVLPADILGQVYEQFLGKVIRLTAGHQAKVEDKPEVKKAGGVFYTPTYIVEYIVRNTVGCLLEGKTPNEAAKLNILNPACGSGSFLIGAYQRLLDWHHDWYVDNGKEKWAKGKEPALYQGPGAEWRLTTSKRNVFDWDKEFPKIFGGPNPGFDAVIGNPPWGALLSELELEYLRQNNRQIIQLVCELYGLTDEEIGIVEESKR